MRTVIEELERRWDNMVLLVYEGDPDEAREQDTKLWDLAKDMLAALKEQDRQLHEGQDDQTKVALDSVIAENTRLRADFASETKALGEMNAKVGRLRAAIKEAPCPQWARTKNGPLCNTCPVDCWKRKSLE